MRYTIIVLILFAWNSKILSCGYFYHTYGDSTFELQDTFLNVKDTLQPKKSNQFLAYPIVFFLPETRWGFGAGGFYNFRFRNESLSSNPSIVQFAISYTQNKQILVTFPFELYFKENLWKFRGELSYYQYVYNFYGVGPLSAKDDLEKYEADFPRLKCDILRRYNRVFAGIKLRYDHIEIASLNEGGLLDRGNYTGKTGGQIGGIGLIAQLDTRDYINNPTKGAFVDGGIFISRPGVVSDFNYNLYYVDAASYFSISNKHIVAVQCSTAMLTGNPIFYELLFFGSPRIMRGFNDRRFIDRNIFVLQSEYRFPIHRWIEGVSFISVANVSNRYFDLFSSTPKLAYGAGLRFVVNKKDRVRIRLDYGLTAHEGGVFYLTLNDAF